MAKRKLFTKREQEERRQQTVVDAKASAADQELLAEMKANAARWDEEVRLSQAEQGIADAKRLQDDAQQIRNLPPTPPYVPAAPKRPRRYVAGEYPEPSDRHLYSEAEWTLMVGVGSKA
jgi:hypothetical protein